MTTIQGQVREVLECWPLELVIETDSSHVEHVTLADNCEVRRAGRRVSPSEITVGSTVTCTSDEKGEPIRVIEIA